MKRNAVHRCLLINEILERIADYTTGILGQEKVTVQSLALSCRAFSSPSLDVLWRNLHGIYPLQRVLQLRSHLEDESASDIDNKVGGDCFIASFLLMESSRTGHNKGTRPR